MVAVVAFTNSVTVTSCVSQSISDITTNIPSKKIKCCNRVRIKEPVLESTEGNVPAWVDYELSTV